MAKKTAGAKNMQPAASPPKKRTGIAVRLEIPPRDHERLSRLARERGLTLASYARQALYERMKDDEGDSK
jgi:hypothetical protein